MKESDTAVFSIYTWYSRGDQDTLNNVLLHRGWAIGYLRTGKTSRHSDLKDQNKFHSCNSKIWEMEKYKHLLNISNEGSGKKSSENILWKANGNVQ